MKITFLGTSAMSPTADRNHSGVLLSYKSENILIDCGENIQRQLRHIGFSPSKLTKLLISHWHGDHSLGIPGLIQYLGANNYEKTFEIYGPKGSKQFMKKIISSFLLQRKIDFVVKEVSGKFFENQDFILEAVQVKHSAPCLAFSFIEKNKRRMNLGYLKKFKLTKNPLLGKLQKGKNVVYKGKKINVRDATIVVPGKKVTYITDTSLAPSCVRIAKKADLLICESTFSSELKEKAKEYYHLTSEDAAQIAKKAGVGKLFLTHFSQRYKDVSPLEREAKKIFKNTKAAEDFLSINL